MPVGEAGARRPGSVVIFWDYDTQWGADRSRGPHGPGAWGGDEFSGTERLLELHAEHRIPACFAVVGAAAESGRRPYHDPGQVRAIHAAGHEVASHSHRHEWLPALDPESLRETLVRSKHALETCIGAPVTTFVPPYNQPFDCPERLAFSLSERRQVRRDRVGLRQLCEALREAGYRMARVTYQPLAEQVVERVLRRRIHRLSAVTRIAGLRCLRLNGAGGFGPASRAMVDRAARAGRIAVLYGHPHSLHSGNAQDERHLGPMLAYIAGLRDAGRLRVMLPRELA